MCDPAAGDEELGVTVPGDGDDKGGDQEATGACRHAS
jgi:hypothetical protein